MEHIFLLAEKIVSQLKTRLIENKESIGYYSFDKSIIHNSSFEIFFKYNESVIQCKLNIHPLDMPWKLDLLINDVRLNNDYEVYPNLLKMPDTLGEELAIRLANDTIEYLKLND